jgi:hypothetical protein
MERTPSFNKSLLKLSAVLTLFIVTGFLWTNVSTLSQTAAVFAQTPPRTYTLWADHGFNGGNCVAGWGWHDSWGESFYQCLGGSVIINHINDSRGSGILWRNNAFPASGNMAIEARIHYPHYAGYGNDPIKLMVGNYNGERTCFNYSQGMYQ